MASDSDRLSRMSQHAPTTFAQSRIEWFRWPKAEIEDQQTREVTRGEQLVASGAYDLWRLEGQTVPGEQNEAMWRLTPRTIWERILKETFQELHSQEANSRFSCGNANAELNTKIQSFMAGDKHDLLLHHFNVKTRELYREKLEKMGKVRVDQG